MERKPKLPRSSSSATIIGRVCKINGQKRIEQKLYRPRLLRNIIAKSYREMCFYKPSLVYGIYTISAGDIPREIGRFDELPDNDNKDDRNGDKQCLSIG